MATSDVAASRTGVVLRGTHRYRLGMARPGCGVGECDDAVDLDGDRSVLVKHLQGGHDTPALRARFGAITETLRGLSSSRLVRVLDGGWGGAPFLVLDAPRAPTLWQWSQEIIAAGRPVSLTTVRRIAEELCHALEAVHRAGARDALVHGLLSAQGVMLVDAKPDTLRLKVMDFGLWPFASPSMASVMPVPASDPRAPELLAQPEAVPTAASDQFALGVVLAMLLTLPARVADAPGWGQMLLEKPEGLEARLRGLRDDLRGSVRGVLARSLHPDPRSRHASIEALRASLLGADWRPAERSATLTTGVAKRPQERDVDEFEKIWGAAWRERARQGVLPAALAAGSPATAPLNPMRGPTMTAPRGQLPAVTAAPVPVMSAPPVHSATPVARRAPDDGATTMLDVVAPNIRWRPPAHTPTATTTYEDDGTTTLELDPRSRTPVEEETTAWALMPARVQATVQTLVDDEYERETVPPMRGVGAEDTTTHTLVDEGETTMAFATPRGGGAPEAVPNDDEATRTLSQQNAVVVPRSPPPVRVPVDARAWDVPQAEATLPVVSRQGPWAGRSPAGPAVPAREMRPTEAPPERDWRAVVIGVVVAVAVVCAVAAWVR